MKRSREPSASFALGSLGSGAVTAAGLAVQQGLAAVVGVVIARELGRSGETDGFFAAYGVFIVLALAATAARSVLLPPLSRARNEHRLIGETAAYAVALGLVALPLLLVSIGGADAIASLVTGFGADSASNAAAVALPWLVAAAIGQLYAGLAASALAALDDYSAAALGYALGSVMGLTLILWRIGENGIEAVAWGVALNALVAVAVPTAVLLRRCIRDTERSDVARPGGPGRGERLRGLGAGVSFPLALQAIYLVCLPFAAGEGVGAITSLGYAYIAGSAVVSITASAMALVTSVPLTRTGLDPKRVTRHVESSAWIAFVAVGATAGVFAVAGGAIAEAVLGGAYGDDVGRELGQLVIALSPWMLVIVGVSVTFPLVFVAGEGRRLPAIALLVFVCHVPLAWLGDTVAGVYGLSLALAASTGIGLVLVLSVLDATVPTLRALAAAAAVVCVVAAVSFIPAGLLLEPALAAACGSLAYATVFVITRPSGLRAGWRYLRALA